MKVTNPILAKKLEDQKVKYLKVQQFSEILPFYSDTIIRNEFEADRFCELANGHGELPLHWGVNWYTDTPTNYPEEKHSQVGFVSVYINCAELFGRDKSYNFASSELLKLIPKIKCHYYDDSNSTFYFLPEEAKEGLDILKKWFVETKDACQVYLKEQRKIELKKELAAYESD